MAVQEIVLEEDISYLHSGRKESVLSNRLSSFQLLSYLRQKILWAKPPVMGTETAPSGSKD